MESKSFFEKRKYKKEEIRRLIEDEDLEPIAEKYGIKEYKKSQNKVNRQKIKKAFFTKEGREEINNLRKNAEYDKVFEKYGTSVYKIAVPYSYQKKELEKFRKEGRYQDIYRKYGEDIYNSYVYEMQMKDMQFETGNKFKAFLNRIGNVIGRRILPTMMSAMVLLPPVGTVTVGVMMDSEKKEVETEYSMQIDSYNERMNEYAESVKDMNLSDIQNIMKVVDDMWKDIKGYGEPEINAIGYYRIDFAQEDGVGVCRNMADHVTYVLNKINPEYNARNFCVGAFMDDIQLANIQRDIIETNETVANEEKEETVENKKTIFDIAYGKSLGNHMVTALDIPGKNLTLIVDATNPSIGVFQDGKITMFWSEDGQGLNLAPIGNSLMSGAFGMAITAKETIDSFFDTDYSIETLKEEWGIEAQNIALQKVRELENKKTEKSFDERYRIENISNENTIKSKANDENETPNRVVENKIEDNER